MSSEQYPRNPTLGMSARIHNGRMKNARDRERLEPGYGAGPALPLCIDVTLNWTRREGMLSFVCQCVFEGCLHVV